MSGTPFKTLWRLSLAELFQQKRFTLLFVLNLALGLSGFVALSQLQEVLDRSLQSRTQAVLGADIGLSSRRPLNDEAVLKAQEVLTQSVETSQARKTAPKTEMIEIYSMIATPSGASRLVQVKAIDAAFPFYGHIELKKGGPQKPGGAAYDLHQGEKIWLYPEVLFQLGINVGEKVVLGGTEFTVSDVVKDDAAAGISTSMAPRVYIGLNQLIKTKLVGPDSLAWYSTLFKAPGNNRQLDSWVQTLFESPEIPKEMKIYSHINVGQQMGRLLKYLNDYLGLVALSALFLSIVGAIFLFRSHLMSKVKQIATLLSLGFNLRQVFATYGLQLAILGLFSSLITFVLASILTPWLISLTQGLISGNVTYTISWQPFALALLLGVVGSQLISWPLLARLKSMKPAFLFRESQSQKLPMNLWSWFFALIGLILFWGLAIWQSHSVYVGSLFTAAFLLSGLFLGLSAYGLFRILDRLTQKARWTLRLPVRQLVRQPVAAVSCFLALGLGMLLINLVPQLEKTLQAELQNPAASKLPSLFLFDIQEEQIDRLKEIVTRYGLNLNQISPMIRARLIQVNGKDFDKGKRSDKAQTREEEREQRFRNRGYNLSYRQDLSDSEMLHRGKVFSGPYDESSEKMPQISLEKRFADRLKLKIGDRLTFDIQSIMITGEVVNLRSVRWTSFQPNFFIQFQPGVLEPAPKTFLGTLPDMTLEKKNLIQRDIVQALPNVSMVDVTRLVTRLSKIMKQMSGALQFMAIFCLIVGFIVLYSIASHQARLRAWDVNLMKVLGAPFSHIRSLFLVEFAILSLAAGLLGVLISLVLSYLLSNLLFDSLWVWEAKTPLLTLIGLVLVTQVISSFSIMRVLRLKPTLLLNSSR